MIYYLCGYIYYNTRVRKLQAKCVFLCVKIICGLLTNCGCLGGLIFVNFENRVVFVHFWCLGCLLKWRGEDV